MAAGAAAEEESRQDSDSWSRTLAALQDELVSQGKSENTARNYVRMLRHLKIRDSVSVDDMLNEEYLGTIKASPENRRGNNQHVAALRSLAALFAATKPPQPEPATPPELPSAAVLAEQVAAALKGKDLASATSRTLRKDLEQRLGLPEGALEPMRSQIQELVRAYVTGAPGAEEQSASAGGTRTSEEGSGESVVEIRNFPEWTDTEELKAVFESAKHNVLRLNIISQGSNSQAASLARARFASAEAAANAVEALQGFEFTPGYPLQLKAVVARSQENAPCAATPPRAAAGQPGGPAKRLRSPTPPRSPLPDAPASSSAPQPGESGDRIEAAKKRLAARLGLPEGWEVVKACRSPGGTLYTMSEVGERLARGPEDSASVAKRAKKVEEEEAKEEVKTPPPADDPEGEPQEPQSTKKLKRATDEGKGHFLKSEVEEDNKAKRRRGGEEDVPRKASVDEAEGDSQENQEDAGDSGTCRLNFCSGRGICFFKFKDASGEKIPFQTTTKAANNSWQEAERIARLCWARFQAGASKDEVTQYRDSLYKELYPEGTPVPSIKASSGSCNGVRYVAQKNCWEFTYQATSGEKFHFQTTLKALNGNKEEAGRIARLCREKFDTGASKDEVREYRDELYRKYNEGHGLEVSADANGDPAGSRHEHAGADACEAGEASVDPAQEEVLAAAALPPSAELLLVRAESRRGRRIQGVYRVLAEQQGDRPAFQRLCQRRLVVLHYSAARSRWRFTDSPENEKRCFAYCKDGAPNPTALQKGWRVYEGSGFVEEAVSISVVDRSQPQWQEELLAELHSSVAAAHKRSAAAFAAESLTAGGADVAGGDEVAGAGPLGERSPEGQHAPKEAAAEADADEIGPEEDDDGA